jgi:hypothetical protein
MLVGSVSPSRVVFRAPMLGSRSVQLTVWDRLRSMCLTGRSRDLLHPQNDPLDKGKRLALNERLVQCNLVWKDAIH